MKKWKIVKIITFIILLLALGYLIYDLVVCLNMTYPHPMLGVDANWWGDQYSLDLAFFFTVFGLPLVLDIVLFIISTKKTKEK